jgi:alpha-L-glutamate ligase-like protein
MRWLFSSWRKLKELRILGINRRNAAYILDYNPRSLYPLVDDKLRMRDLCLEIGAPTPEIYATINCHSSLRRLDEILRDREEFVVKPNRGSAGRGVLVIVGRAGRDFRRHNGEELSREELRQHLSDVLSGMYSLGGLPDRAILQQRVRLHPAFEPVAFQGIPDIRVVLYRNEPAMAMLRLPTRESNGRANLHQGGLGVGIDLASGLTHHAVQRNRLIMCHPDTGAPVIGLRTPYWRQVLDMSRRVAEAVGLGYLGVDIVIDAVQGPMLLEANARPGLAIQIANARGLISRLEEIDEWKEAEGKIRNPKFETRKSSVGGQEPLRKSA